MSIQRYHFYNIYGTPIPDNKLKDDAGDYVLYTAHAAEVERLTGERDAAVRERDAAKKALSMWERPHDDKDLLAMQEQAKGGGLAAMQAYINALKWHLKQKSMERDAAVEALRDVLTLFAKGFPAPEIARARAALAGIEGRRK